MAITTAIAIGATVMAGTSAYGAYQSSQAKSEAIDESGKQQAEAKQAADLAIKQQADTKTAQDKINADKTAADQANVLMLMQQRRRVQYSGISQSLGGTLVTGPQGAASTPGNVVGKSLLGA